MKDVMKRALLFDGSAMISVWNMPKAAQEGARIFCRHGFARTQLRIDVF